MEIHPKSPEKTDTNSTRQGDKRPRFGKQEGNSEHSTAIAVCTHDTATSSHSKPSSCVRLLEQWAKQPTEMSAQLKAIDKKAKTESTDEGSLDDLVEEYHNDPEKRNVHNRRTIDQKFSKTIIDNVRNNAGYHAKELDQTFSYQIPEGKYTEGKKLVPALEQALLNFETKDINDKGGTFQIDRERMVFFNKYLREQPKETMRKEEGQKLLADHSDLEKEEGQLRKNIDAESRTRVTAIRTEKQKIYEAFYTQEKFSDSSKQGYNPKEAIDKLCEIESSGKLKYLFEHPLALRGQENLTLREHTEQVAMRFETFFAPTWKDKFESIMPLEDARKYLLVQDLGKPLLARSEQQSLATIPLIAEIAPKMVHNNPDTARLLLDTSKLDLGELQKQVEGKKGDKSKKTEDVVNDSAKYIKKVALKHNVEPKVLAQVFEAFYQCDMGSYASMSRFTPIEIDDQGNLQLGFDRQRQQGSKALYDALDKLEV